MVFYWETTHAHAMELDLRAAWSAYLHQHQSRFLLQLLKPDLRHRLLKRKSLLQLPNL